MTIRERIEAARAWPWWVLALLLLAALLFVGGIGDGWAFRTAGALIKTALGLALGYYAHRHLVNQGEKIDPNDNTAAAQSRRLARAVIMGACALAVALAV